jgi:hypothetical protein
MQSRRKMIVIALAVMLTLFFLGAVGLVVLKFIHFTDAETVLKGDKARLEFLYGQNPFPSEANLHVERENIQTIKQEVSDLQAAMGAGQIEPVVQSPARFITQFFDTQRNLLAKASAAGITVPKTFDFGFGRHMKGDLPAPQDVPRLTQQLKIVEALCQALYAGNIASLDAFSRQEFEVDAVAGLGGKVAPAARAGELDLKNSVDVGAGLVPEGQYYGRWRFSVQFKARESGLMKILNGLANSSIFTVVTRMEIKGDEKVFERKDGAGAAVKETAGGETEKEAPKTRDYRVVCGRENLLTIKMEVEVLQFAKPQATASEKQPGGVK